jgi:hypothetical protein
MKTRLRSAASFLWQAVTLLLLVLCGLMYNEISLADFLTCHSPPPKQGDSSSQALGDSLDSSMIFQTPFGRIKKRLPSTGAINRRHHRFPNDVRREIGSSRAWYQMNWDPDVTIYMYGV